MAETSGISWTDATFNPWIGCTKVSPGCDHCYAERDWATRRKVVQWGPGAARKRTSDANWRLPLSWNRKAEREDRRMRVFCASLADVFDNYVPPEWRVDLFSMIADTPHLDWLLLTKRIGNARQMLNGVIEELSHGINTWDELPWPNVWLGATVVNQVEADRDIPKLLQLPARARFLSVEPMLGPVDLTDITDGHTDSTIPRQYWTDMDGQGDPPAVGHNALTGERWQRFGEWMEHGPRIDCVICGGESGPHARPMHPDWARSLRDQCAAAGVPFHFKQWGEWLPVELPSDEECYAEDGSNRALEGRIRVQRVGYQDFARIGNADAGRLLDGRTHDEFPSC